MRTADREIQIEVRGYSGLDMAKESSYRVRTNVRQPAMPAILLAPRDSAAKLQHILRHAAQIFAQRSFGGASLRDISRATGVSLSGLYYYFESKQHLLYLIQNNAITGILQGLSSRLNGLQDPQARLRIFIRNHVEYFLAHPYEMKILSHEEDALKEPFKSAIAGTQRRYYALAREIFEELAGGGTVPGLNPRIAVLSLFGMMNCIYKWYNAKVDPGAEELTEAINAIFLRGVLPASRRTAGQTAIESPRFEKIAIPD
jgi:AcrR family transcriptional regulator